MASTGRRGRTRLHRLLIRARSRLTRLRPRQASQAVDAGARLIDIRPEYQRRADGEIPGAIIIERNQLEWRLDPASRDRIPEASDADVSWIVICDQGYASSLAAATLRQIGLRRATDVIGGFQAWRKARLPVRLRAPLSQPRLAAGDNRALHTRSS